MKVLVAIDGSAQALAALESFVDTFTYFREAPKLTLINVHPPVPYKRAVAWAGHEAVAQYYEEESEAALVGARGLLDARGIAFVVEKCVGEPADEIVRHAAAEKFDMIVMGTHGHTALANLVMGSVATKVLAASKVPVLFIRR